jgi:hypothetical protein
MKIEKALFLFVSVFFLVSVPTVWGSNEIGYGVYLYKHGNYTGAILELERYIYYNPVDPYTPYLQLLVGLSYANEAQYIRAFSSLSDLDLSAESIQDHKKREALLCESQFQRLNILFRQKRFSDFQLETEKIEENCFDIDRRIEEYIYYMASARYIFDFQWEEALAVVKESGFPKGQLKEDLIGDIDSMIDHREKSPVVGGLLSVIPGLGHLYAGRYSDGARSLLFNTAFTTLSVFSFRERQYVLAGIFTTIEALLYVSNIYGGVNAVLQENARYVIQKRDSVLKKIPVPPLDVITLRKELNL